MIIISVSIFRYNSHFLRKKLTEEITSWSNYYASVLIPVIIGYSHFIYLYKNKKRLFVNILFSFFYEVWVTSHLTEGIWEFERITNWVVWSSWRGEVYLIHVLTSLILVKKNWIINHLLERSWGCTWMINWITWSTEPGAESVISLMY